jgi:hypothetical protein
MQYRETAVSALAPASNTAKCEECDGTAKLVTVVRARDNKTAWSVFKCEDCGFYNWMMAGNTTGRQSGRGDERLN